MHGRGSRDGIGGASINDGVTGQAGLGIARTGRRNQRKTGERKSSVRMRLQKQHFPFASGSASSAAS